MYVFFCLFYLSRKYLGNKFNILWNEFVCSFIQFIQFNSRLEFKIYLKGKKIKENNKNQ